MAKNGIKTVNTLYHVKYVMVDWNHDPSGATQTIHIHGTFGDLANAKASARICLYEEGYERDWFSSFETNIAECQRTMNATQWKYGDGVLVHAIATSGEEFSVGIDTVENSEDLTDAIDATGKVACELFHVIQTTIYYNDDRSGCKRLVQVQGSYRQREHAAKAAKKMLLDGSTKREDFEEYDENDDGQDGDDVVVHAVCSNGINVLLTVVKK